MKLASVIKQSQNYAGKAVDAILPPRCIVSGEIVDCQGVLAPQIWKELRFISDPKCIKCGYPFDFEIGNDAICMGCQGGEPEFATARSALVYEGTSRDLILKFKHGDQTHAVSLFVPWLKQAGADILTEIDILTPVPLHRWRLLKRRYNQSALITQALAKSTDIPVELDLLYRSKSTPSQGTLNYKQRHENVRGAFGISPFRREMVKNKVITLVDDVYTTGATVGQCAKVLKKAGALKVHVLTICRVVRAV